MGKRLSLEMLGFTGAVNWEILRFTGKGAGEERRRRSLISFEINYWGNRLRRISERELEELTGRSVGL